MTEGCPCRCDYREGAYVPPHMTYDALWQDAFLLAQLLTQYRFSRDGLQASQETIRGLKPLVDQLEQMLQEKDAQQDQMQRPG